MRMRHQLIVVAALAAAVLAVGVNVYAATIAAEQREARAASAPRAVGPFDFGEGDTPAATPASQSHHRTAPTPASDPCPGSEPCRTSPPPHASTGQHENHGRMVSAFAAHIGYDELIDGPPGALVRTIARPDIANDGPPRSDRAEERRNADHGQPSASQGSRGNRGRGSNDG